MAMMLTAFGTLGMVGVIWMVQLVQYPGLAHVGEAEFKTHHAHHCAQISWVVIPLMFAELGGSLWLLAMSPAQIPVWSLWLGVALVLGVWVSTFMVQVPQHGRLSKGFDRATIQQLVAGNWI